MHIYIVAIIFAGSGGNMRPADGPTLRHLASKCGGLHENRRETTWEAHSCQQGAVMPAAKTLLVLLGPHLSLFM
jgi:hypothetical protein